MGCNDVTLTWTAATGANKYDIRVSRNGGAPTSVTTNVTGTTYSDAAAYTAGDSLAYQVLPRFNASNGNWSNSSTVTGWDRFKINSIVFTPSGAANNNLAVGESVAITFSKAVKAGTVTNTNIYQTNTGGTRGIWFGATSAAGAGNADIGGIGTSNGLITFTGTLPGSASFNAGRTVWTWTATSAQASVTSGAYPTTGFTFGASAGAALCNADSTGLNTTAPSISGSW
jgi:hypothetical protein